MRAQYSARSKMNVYISKTTSMKVVLVMKIMNAAAFIGPPETADGRRLAQEKKRTET